MGKDRKLDIILTEEQRSSMEVIIRKGMGLAMKIRCANVILMVDGSRGNRMKDVDVAKALGITPQAVHNIKARFIDSTAGHGEEVARKAGDAVKRKERNTPPVPPKCTGDVEARIIALAYSEPPEGRSKWTLWLLPKKSVGLKIMDTIYHMQAGRILK